ncbi:MAG TPA: sulfatase-like hydrolase/transferase [Candidatus Polarisedimenticolaceae bacterium]|nr:sulfatase-like hydrolase/transferase [Candidatus Polarisedimenticolaceae bacterium]
MRPPGRDLGPQRRPRWPVLLLLSLVIYACGERRTGLGALPRGIHAANLNLVVVTLDTTRADRIGCYGAKNVATPHLDALAKDGVRFTRAVSPMPLTLPAHCTIFTGLLPGAHGVRDNGGFKLSPEHVTLAEVLEERGFATGGFVSAFVLDHRWGIAQGFDTYFDDFDLKQQEKLSMGDIQRPGNETVDHAVAWLRTVKDKRFFAWIHLYDPHAPYAPPEPYRSQYRDRPYDGEIAWTDELVGRILASLRDLGVADRTVVAVLADHGESLGEHGEHGHGYFVYEQVTHIPLLLVTPYSGTRGKVVDAVVKSIDLAPTLLDLLGVAGVTLGTGSSAVPLVTGASAAGGDGYSESFYARLHYGWSELRAVRTKRWHFIEAPKAELYDLDADPGETTNVASRELDVIDRLRGSLGEFEKESIAKLAAAAPVEEDEETLKKLASLGYVGGTTDTSGKSWRDLPDPKDRLPVYDDMNHVRELVKDGKEAEAVPILQAILAKAPEVIDAYYTLGNCLAKDHKFTEAAAYYKKTLELRPDHDYAMIGLADMLVAEGKVDDAIAGYTHFLSQDPKNAQILYRLAQVQLDDGRDADAAANFKKTLDAEPRTARAEVGLGVVAFHQGRSDEAALGLKKALAIDPKARWARYNLALIAEARKDVQGAIAGYRAEIADYPDAYKAQFNLGILLGKSGDLPGAVAALQACVTHEPNWPIGRFYLAKALILSGDVPGAKDQALRGLAIDDKSSYAAVGHYVLADVYNRSGDAALARSEMNKAAALDRN